MNLRGVVVCLLVMLSIGAAIAEDGEWEEVLIDDAGGAFEGEGDYLSYSGTYGGEFGGEGDYLSYSGTYDGGGVVGDTTFMFNGPGDGPGDIPYGDSQYGDSGFSEYTQYFSMEEPSSSGTAFEAYSVSGQEPSMLYFGGKSVSYSTYKSTYGWANALWIQGSTGWTQYAVCPMGAWLRLLAYNPSGGNTDFYEIYPSGRVLHKSYWFPPGYSRMTFHADEVGRHILLFVSGNQPSNAVIVDVRSGGWPPWPPGPSPSPSYSRVTIKSNWLRGYNVAVDGIHECNDVSDGSLDGMCTFTVSGNQYHNIKISNVGFSKTYYKYFKSGYHYTLTV